MMMHFVVDNNNSTYCFIRTQKFSQRNKYKNEDYKKRSENSHLETAKANREKWLGHQCKQLKQTNLNSNTHTYTLTHIMHADIHMHTQTNKKITNKRDEHTKSISMSQSVVRDKQFFWEVLKTGTTIRFK